ncbi:CatB-related O-acetyltransferase [Flavobacterium daemonense]|uniref:CatB-related O-acetyltransferase n=1 Tax=Flavobacterium daemonense TaxID=1393049 RepID=UPI0011851E76|nr:CatB-related O-acetyltransferase [Flavobacterium daemonense]KAF2332507.1 CatB-related O-acetyltransferase [Flavobacterium daemonense]
MGKINLTYIFKNIYKLIKVVLTRKEVNWDCLSLKIFDSEISKEAKIYSPCSINKISVGRGTYISMNSSISYTKIGKFCSIGPNLICGWGIHPLQGISTSPVFYSSQKQAEFSFSSKTKIDERKEIIIGNDVFIGANVTILDGVTIGNGAVIGAGAVVNKDIPPYAIAVGCPIQVIKFRFPKETIEKLMVTKWWDYNDEKLKEVEKKIFEVEKFIR